jgi:hypothetical protein
MKKHITLARQAIKTLRADAVFFKISLVLMRLAIPEELSGTRTVRGCRGMRQC